MKMNSILFSITDVEDGWVNSGLCFKIDNLEKKNYEDCYNELKDKLESPEVVNYVINNVGFDVENYEFKSTYWNFGLVYQFENDEGDILLHKFTQTDTILSF